jgi:thiol-disulfide isomerase/thioredoxin
MKRTAYCRVSVAILSIFPLLAPARNAGAQDSVNTPRQAVEPLHRRHVSKSYPVLSGVGLALVSKDGHVVVGKIIPKTPAAESGQISEGARIVSIEVDGKDLNVEGKAVGDVVSLVRGPVGTKLAIGLLSPNADAPIKVTLIRAPLEIEGVPNSTYEAFIGKPMTQLAFSSLDGSDSETLANYRGKVVVLDFWASWCPACYQPVAKLQRIVADNPHWKGQVEVIAVTVDAEVDKAIAVVKEQDWNNTRHRAADHDKLKECGISVIPVVVIVDADGTVATMAGAHALDVAKEVERLLSPRPVPASPEP